MVRSFIADNYPERLRGKLEEGEEWTKDDYLAWHRILARQGWVATAWPKQYGGTGWTPTQRFTVSEGPAAADTIPDRKRVREGKSVAGRGERGECGKTQK